MAELACTEKRLTRNLRRFGGGVQLNNEGDLL